MSTRETPEVRFVICLRNEGCPASLELRKLYRVVPDADAATRGHVRVVDESGEDYLYPAAYFVEAELPHAIEEALLRASGAPMVCCRLLISNTLRASPRANIHLGMIP